MVDKTSNSKQRQSRYHPLPRSFHRLRCIKYRVGRGVSGRKNRWLLERIRSTAAHKCHGITGSFFSSKIRHSKLIQCCGAPTDRHSDSRCAHKSVRRNTIMHSKPADSANLAMVQRTPYNAVRRTNSRVVKRCGRLGKQKFTGIQQLDPQSDNISKHSETTRSIGRRFIRVETNTSAP